jgi:Metallo-peptidase family M12B Reprolysin-like
MRTLRQLMTCAGIDSSGNVSVLFHYFGFGRGRVPTDPDTTATATVSVLEQARAVDGKHFHLNVIRVGFDTLSQADQDDGAEKIDYAVLRIRRIYRAEGLGVSRIQHFVINAADANGRDDLGSESEADALSDEFSGPDDKAIDAFVVRNISDPDFVGISPLKGSCDKGDDDDGLIAGEIGRDDESFARTFAHEVGHYLGLPHNHGSSCPTTDAAQRNLMAQTKCVPMISGTSTRDVRNAVRLTSSQGSTMRGHCSVKEGC